MVMAMLRSGIRQRGELGLIQSRFDNRRIRNLSSDLLVHLFQRIH